MTHKAVRCLTYIVTIYIFINIAIEIRTNLQNGNVMVINQIWRWQHQQQQHIYIYFSFVSISIYFAEKYITQKQHQIEIHQWLTEQILESWNIFYICMKREEINTEAKIVKSLLSIYKKMQIIVYVYTYRYKSINLDHQ